MKTPLGKQPFFLGLLRIFLFFILTLLLTFAISFVAIKYQQFKVEKQELLSLTEQAKELKLPIYSIDTDFENDDSVLTFIKFIRDSQYFINIQKDMNKQLDEYRGFLNGYVNTLENCPLLKENSETSNQIKDNIYQMKYELNQNNIIYAYQIFQQTEKLRLKLQEEQQLKFKKYKLEQIYQYKDYYKLPNEKDIQFIVSLNNNQLYKYKDLINRIYFTTWTELETDKSLKQATENINSKIKHMELICSVYHCHIPKKRNMDKFPKHKNFNSFAQSVDYYNSIKEAYDKYVISRGSWESKKRILISTHQQHMYLIDNYDLYTDFPASTGRYGAATALGEFKVWEKLGTVWGIYDIWMPYWMTIYYVGNAKNGIHGIPIGADGVRWSDWERYVGIQPMTIGCVMPRDKDAKTVYNWADIGTPVSIVW